nr:hypothetical protein [uncultured Rhodoferax sp.]
MTCARWWQAACVGLVLTASLTAAAQGAAAAAGKPQGLQPLIEKARGGQCVEDAAFMRRNHMKLLKHQRDDTLRGGVRTGKYSLKACVSCHASQSTQSVNASSGDFCQSCHAYAAVKIDCFECHANKPAVKEVPSGLAQQPAGVGQAQIAQMQQMLVQEKAKP